MAILPIGDVPVRVGQQQAEESLANYKANCKAQLDRISKDGEMEVAKVKKDLKKYEKQFEKADKERARALYLEETKGKRLERKKIRDILANIKNLRRQQRARHIEMLDGYDSDDDANYVVREVSIETVLSTKEEVVN